MTVYPIDLNRVINATTFRLRVPTVHHNVYIRFITKTTEKRSTIYFFVYTIHSSLSNSMFEKSPKNFR
jgi:hypothetical protein